jgi:hypothetical protein
VLGTVRISEGLNALCDNAPFLVGQLNCPLNVFGWVLAFFEGTISQNY